ncbi:MAG: sugar phosphate isomerase/epimerase family protein [Kiritimatiellia bacterium]
MIKAITLRSFPESMPWRDCFRECREAGFEGVEVNFDGMFDLDCPLKTLKAIKATARNNAIRIVSVYSRRQWQTPISSPDKLKRENGRKVIARLVDIAEILEAPTVLIIPGAVDNSILSKEIEIVPYNEVYDRALEALSSLASAAARKRITLALENVPNKFLLSPLEMRDFIDKVAAPSAGCYLDVANCLYNGGYPEDWIRILGHRIKAVHLKDFRLAIGNQEGFTGIFEGDVNWAKVCRALAAINYNGPLVSEVLPAYKHHPEMLWITAGLAIDRIICDIKKRKH